MSSDSTAAAEFSMSQLSLHSNGSQSEDWDRSLIVNEVDLTLDALTNTKTPRNSVAFPANGEIDATPKGPAGTKGKRSLSELLRLHAEKGTECRFSPEEAARVADVLGQWVRCSVTLSVYKARLCRLDQCIIFTLRRRGRFFRQGIAR